MREMSRMSWNCKREAEQIKKTETSKKETEMGFKKTAAEKETLKFAERG